MLTERTIVENYIVEKLQELGWLYVLPQNIVRESYEEPLLIKNLISSIQRINKVDLSESDLKNIVNELRYKSTDVEGIKAVLGYLKDGISIKPEKGNVLKRINLIDYSNPENNEFIVTRQVTYKSEKTIRPDIVLYVNGIPLVVIECKDPTNPEVSWYDAYKQIKRYEKDFPELFKYVQFSIAAAERTKYFPNVPWLDNVDIHTWRNENFDELEATLEILSKDVLIDLIKNFVFIREEKGRANKVIARYMQYRATNKIVNRVINNILGKEEKNMGLIWHWQGSGKTLTMIFAAYKLYSSKLLENPTIFYIVDRKELEEQLYEEFSSLDLGISAERVTSIKNLIEILSHDEGRGRRGIFITLIHKFRNEEIKEFEEKAGIDIILERKNVIAFVDEGHRSQYGSLAAVMRKILRNAFFFAFTGTPIAKIGRDTYRAFSPPDEQYLDRYFILDSIKDGFTVQIYYQPRLQDKVHLDKEKLEFFLTQEFEELPEECQEEVEIAVKRKLNSIKVFLKNKNRIKKIAADIAEHFKDKVDSKFKAMIVAVDRETCVMYKKAIDKYLPREYLEVVMTFNKNDPRMISDYFNELTNRFNRYDTESILKEIIRKFKEEEYPKILIVTDMLLTGFDAPILQVMYLDKPLKEHRLLQAIARTNRPFKGIKEAGIVIDYIGIFSDLTKAFAIYSTEDVRGVAFNIDSLKTLYEKKMQEILAIFEGIDRTKGDRPTLMQSLRRLLEKDNARKFENLYKEIRAINELLGPDPIKAEYLRDFRWITKVYYAYYRMIKKRDPEEHEKYVQKYYKKTLEYIHKSIDIGEIRKDFPIIPLDEKYLKRIEKKFPNLNDRVIELTFMLQNTIVLKRGENPLYESLAEKIERIVQSWREQKEDVEKAYQKLCEVVNEFNEAIKKQKELGLTDLEYFILYILKESVDKSEKELIDDVKELLDSIQDKMFRGWSLQRTALQDIKKRVRLFLIKKYKTIIGFDGINMVQKKILNTLVRFD